MKPIDRIKHYINQATNPQGSPEQLRACGATATDAFSLGRRNALRALLLSGIGAVLAGCGAMEINPKEYAVCIKSEPSPVFDEGFF
ncbi:MAG: hypothetical protein ACOY3I_10295 [Verrucomicrobiota bacterium]